MYGKPFYLSVGVSFGGDLETAISYYLNIKKEKVFIDKSQKAVFPKSNSWEREILFRIITLFQLKENLLTTEDRQLL